MSDPVALLFGECGCCGPQNNPYKRIIADKFFHGWAGFVHPRNPEYTSYNRRWLRKVYEYDETGFFPTSYKGGIVIDRQNGHTAIIESRTSDVPYDNFTGDVNYGPPGPVGGPQEQWTSIEIEDNGSAGQIWTAKFDDDVNNRHVQVKVTMDLEHLKSEFLADVNHLLNDVVQFDSLNWGDTAHVSYKNERQNTYTDISSYNPNPAGETTIPWPYGYEMVWPLTAVQIIRNFPAPEVPEVEFYVDPLDPPPSAFEGIHARTFFDHLFHEDCLKMKSQILWHGDWCERTARIHWNDDGQQEITISGLTKTDPADVLTNVHGEKVVQTLPDEFDFQTDYDYYDSDKRVIRYGEAKPDGSECVCWGPDLNNALSLGEFDTFMDYQIDVPASAVRVEILVSPCQANLVAIYHRYDDAPTVSVYDHKTYCSMIFDLLPGAGELLLENPGTTWFVGVGNETGGPTDITITFRIKRTCDYILQQNV